MSFIARAITLKIERHDGWTFGDEDSTVVTLSGLRVSVRAGAASLGHAQVRIFGLSSTLMAQLSTYGLPVNIASTPTMTVMAEDSVSGMPIAFEGTIQSAWADYSQMPDVAFNVELYEGYSNGLKISPPLSINGGIDAAQIVQQLAQKWATRSRITASRCSWTALISGAI